MGVETSEPIISERMAELNFTNEGGVDGTIRVLKNICGMWLLERCRAEWNDSMSYPELIAMAQAEPRDAVINPDDPAFANPASMTQAIADYCRRTGQNVPQSRGAMVRCIFESLAHRYAEVMELLRQVSPVRPKVLHVIGGGSRNDMLNQLTANVVGMPVVAGPAEATAIGNIMVQAVAAGEARSIGQLRSRLSRSAELKRFEPQCQ